MEKDPCFILIDKEERVLKKDDNGMLCIFDTEKDAKRYFRMLGRLDQNESEIVKRASIKFEKAES